MVYVNYVVGLVMSHKALLSNEDLTQTEKDSKEEAGEKITEFVCKITSKRLPKALRINDPLAAAIVDEDSPNTERNIKVRRDVLTSLRCYFRILKKNRKYKVSRGHWIITLKQHNKT
jgi:inosine-uridine nucleoside N-ribohydrolase